MTKPLALGLLLVLAAWPAAARDRLPLARGVYVDASKPCKGASSADTLSYWGGDNGVNAAQVACKIERIGREGDILALRRICHPIGSGRAFRDRRNLKILGRFSFMIGADETSPPAGPVFRYCGAKAIL